MKLVCIGDSLTYGYGIDPKKSWVSHMTEKLDFPVINEGVPGNRTSEMLARFDDSVLRHHPTHMLIMGGTNDVMMSTPTQETCECLRRVLLMAKENRVIPILMLPIPVNTLLVEKTWFVDRDYGEANKDLEEICQQMKVYCQDQSIQIVDLFHLQTVEAWQSTYIADGIHINEAGHLRIFETIYENIKCEEEKSV